MTSSRNWDCADWKALGRRVLSASKFEMNDSGAAAGSSFNIAPALRIARPAEYAELGRIALQAKGSWGYADAQLDAWRGDLSVSPESISRMPTFVAEVEGSVCGWCQLDVEREPAHLEHLWVLPEAMGRGIGRALVVHAAAHAAQHGVSALWIQSDPNAESFYVACGARRTGEIAAPIEGSPHRVLPLMVLPTVRGGG